MDTIKWDGETSATIWQNYAPRQGGGGRFVCLLQENSLRSGVCCSRCAAVGEVTMVMELVAYLPLHIGLMLTDGDWRPLCGTCAIALIEYWLKESGKQSARAPSE